MKLSVSIADDDVAFLDEFAEKHDVASRSAVISRAVALLRASELRDAYADAWADWDADDAGVWDAASGDGLT